MGCRARTQSFSSLACGARTSFEMYIFVLKVEYLPVAGVCSIYIYISTRRRGTCVQSNMLSILTLNRGREQQWIGAEAILHTSLCARCFGGTRCEVVVSLRDAPFPICGQCVRAGDRHHRVWGAIFATRARQMVCDLGFDRNRFFFLGEPAERRSIFSHHTGPHCVYSRCGSFVWRLSE